MLDIPAFIPAVFVITLLITIYFFYKASQNSKIFLVLVSFWILLHGALALNGFYLVTDTIPPRFIILVAPPFLLIAYLMISKRGLAFTDRLDSEMITWIHAVRVPVELVIYWLFLQKLMPEVMTFQGRNFDIIMGLTAPIIAWLVFFRNRYGNNLIMWWNSIGIILLLNIVIIAILSTPTVLQQMSFEQPNVGILYFPFVYLAGIIVPIIMYCHFAALRRALTTRKII